MNKYNIPTQCPRNEGVMCDNHAKCGSCGWNPKVSEARLQEMLRRIKGNEMIRIQCKLDR